MEDRGCQKRVDAIKRDTDYLLDELVQRIEELEEQAGKYEEEIEELKNQINNIK